MPVRFHTAADGAEQVCLKEYLNLSEKSFPDGTSCLCAQRLTVMADDAAQMVSQGPKKACHHCRDNASAEPEAHSSILLSAQTENLKQPAARIPSVITEVGTAGRGVVEESSLTSCVQVAKAVDVGMDKEDSVDADKAYDADKACAAVASLSEPAETATGDEQKNCLLYTSPSPRDS